jgi:hypothetical protein
MTGDAKAGAKAAVAGEDVIDCPKRKSSIVQLKS